MARRRIATFDFGFRFQILAGQHTSKYGQWPDDALTTGICRLEAAAEQSDGI
jgi:hypothetical protein